MIKNRLFFLFTTSYMANFYNHLQIFTQFYFHFHNYWRLLHNLYHCATSENSTKESSDHPVDFSELSVTIVPVVRNTV